MARKLAESLIDHAAALMRDGSTLGHAAETIGCNPDVLSVYLRQRGVDTAVGKRRSTPRLDLPAEDIIAAYQAGHGTTALAAQYGVVPQTIRKLLIHNSVAIRSRFEANQLIAAFKTPEQHIAGITAARTVRHNNMVRASHDATLPNPAIGVGERELAATLKASGLPVRQQVLVDGYLIDIVVEDIAVEVTANVTHAAPSRNPSRFKKLIERDFMVIFAIIPNTAAFARQRQNFITTIDSAYRQPTVRGEYWVVRCGLHDTGTDYEANEWSCIKCTPKTLNTAT